MLIDLRGSIMSVLQGYSPGAVTAFLSVYYYGHSPQAVADALYLRTEVVQDWIYSIRSDIRRLYRREGGTINEGGSTVAGFDAPEAVYEESRYSPADSFTDD
jgi:DNA-directed RNA polymerase specialized sigma24 family protein